MSDEDEGPDGIIVIHYPADGSAPYGVGPFPPVAEMVDAVIENGPCDCRKEPLPIVFPRGISMAIDVTEMAVAAAEQVMAKALGEERKDRLN